MTPPGWSAFDVQLVNQLHQAAGSRDAPCPFKGHQHRLAWARGGYTKGTEYHGDPEVSFRVSPTYVLADHLQNFIVGPELVDQLTGKAETWRLGNENSEDALSFNVFRSLQEAGLLADVARLLTGREIDGEPQLIVWGHRLDTTTAHPVPELKTALNKLEGTAGQQTEPDVILRIPGWGWIFIEAKLASPTSTYKAHPHKLATWKQRYTNPDLFDAAGLAAADPDTFPEQLLRNVAVAHAVAAGEHTAVIALVRKAYAPAVADWANGYLADECVIARSATWEQIHGLAERHDALATLRSYLGDKSVNLRPAFTL